MSKQPRVSYITREEWTDATLDVFVGMERTQEDQERARREGSKMNLINVLAHSPRIVVPYLNMNKELFQLSISAREREIAVLRLSHLCNSEYEWFQHVEFGKRAGLDEGDIEAIQLGIPLPSWSDRDIVAMAVVDELQSTETISDALWAELSEHFDREQVFELLFVIGAYKMTAWIVNPLQVPPEDEIQI